MSFLLLQEGIALVLPAVGEQGLLFRIAS